MENLVLVAVLLTDTNPQKLKDLLTAIRPEMANRDRCAGVWYSVDPDGPGAVYEGNSDVSTTNWGRKIQQAINTPPAADWNVISLDDIYLLAEEANTRVGVSVLFR